MAMESLPDRQHRHSKCGKERKEEEEEEGSTKYTKKGGCLRAYHTILFLALLLLGW